MEDRGPKMPGLQLGELPLNNNNRRRVIDPANQKKIARRKHDEHRAVKLQQKAANEQGRDGGMTNPKLREKYCHRGAEDELHHLTNCQGPQPRAKVRQFPFSELIQGKGILPLQVSVQGLPGGFQFIEFSCRHGYSSCLVRVWRRRSLRRLNFVATFVSVIPRISAISR